MASISAKALAHEITENSRKPKGARLTLGALLLKHGYSVHTSRQPSRVIQTKSFQDEAAPHVERLKALRERIAKRMEATVDKASFGNLPYALHAVQEQIALLTGKPTSIQFGAHIDLTPEDEKKIRRLLS